MAARQKLPDEPSFCFEVKPKHIQNRFQLSKICPREFNEHNYEKFGLNKEDITLSSNEYPGIFLDGLEEFFEFHKIKVDDRVCFQVNSEVQFHLHVFIHRSTAVSLIVTKIENIASMLQCTVAATTPILAIPLSGGGDSMPRINKAVAFIAPKAPSSPSMMTSPNSPSVMTLSSSSVMSSLPSSLVITPPVVITPPMVITPPVVITHPGSPLVVIPHVSSMPSSPTNVNNAVRVNKKKHLKEHHFNKAQQPQVIYPERTRLGSGVLCKINYCEDVLLGRSINNANVDGVDPPEVQAHKKKVKAGCSLEQHLDLLIQAAEGATCDASTECVDGQLSIVIEKTPTCPLAIKYWMDQVFLENYSRLLKECHAKDVLLINDQLGLKWRVPWNCGLQEVDHTNTGWGAFVAANNLRNGDQCDLKVVQKVPIEFKVSFIRHSGSKPPGYGMTRLLKDKAKEKVALEGLERSYGSEGDAIALDNRQHQYRSHFRFQADLSDNGKFYYSSDCPGTYARITPYPKKSRSGRRFQPYKKSQLPCKQSQPGTSFVLAPGLAVQEYIIQEFMKATPSTSVAEAKPKRGRPRKRT